MNPDGSMDEEDWKKLRREVSGARAASEERRRNSVANRLHRKLLECGLAVNKPERLRPGHWQRSSGAWVWQASFNFDICQRNGWVGSQETMEDCARMTNARLVDELNSYLASYERHHALVESPETPEKQPKNT